MGNIHYPYEIPTSTEWRIVFNIIATPVFVALAFIAAKCYEYHLRLRIVKGERVPLVDALGWLRGTTVISAPLKLRNVPGRWWYAFMILIALVSYATHLLPSTIESYEGRALRAFDTGLLIDSRSAFYVNPTAYTASFALAQNAQRYSRDVNGCQAGIFDRVPQYPADLCAQWPNPSMRGNQSEIIGWWTCNSVANETYARGTNQTAIIRAAKARNLLYNSTAYSDWSNNKTHTHLMVWSTNATQEQGELWSVKFGIELYQDTWNGAAPQMNYSLCTLYPSPIDPNNSTLRIATTINSQNFIKNWAPLLPTYGYYGINSDARSNVNEAVAGLLNTAFMISGSGDEPMGQAASGTTIYYGCIGTGTLIPSYVVAFVGVSAGLVLIMAIIVLVLYLILRHKRAFTVTKTMPLDLFGWVTLSAASADGEEQNDAFDNKRALFKGLAIELGKDGKLTITRTHDPLKHGSVKHGPRV